MSLFPPSFSDGATGAMQGCRTKLQKSSSWGRVVDRSSALCNRYYASYARINYSTDRGHELIDQATEVGWRNSMIEIRIPGFSYLLIVGFSSLSALHSTWIRY